MIFHITSLKDWKTAQANDNYHAESLAIEGFIHCSTASQILPVAENFYKGHHGLVLLAIEPTLLSSDLKWEPPSGGIPPPGIPKEDLFPHIYGPINLDAVVNVVALDEDLQGKFKIPIF